MSRRKLLSLMDGVARASKELHWLDTEDAFEREAGLHQLRGMALDIASHIDVILAETTTLNPCEQAHSEQGSERCAGTTA